jgi:hypothetical protein
MFSNDFNIPISKIIFKNKKKYYFNIFLNKNTLKNNQWYFNTPSRWPRGKSVIIETKIKVLQSENL